MGRYIFNSCWRRSLDKKERFRENEPAPFVGITRFSYKKVALTLQIDLYL